MIEVVTNDSTDERRTKATTIDLIELRRESVVRALDLALVPVLDLALIPVLELALVPVLLVRRVFFFDQTCC